MKPFTVEIVVDLPRDRVIELFDNPDNLALRRQNLHFLRYFKKFAKEESF
jgi:hypothetical protein